MALITSLVSIVRVATFVAVLQRELQNQRNILNYMPAFQVVNLYKSSSSSHTLPFTRRGSETKSMVCL